MKNTILILSTVALIFSTLFYNCDSNNNTVNLSAAQQDTVKMVEKAYMAGFSLVIMELTKNQFVSPFTPINTFTKNYKFVNAGDTSVVAPNVDNYYAVGFLDLSEGGLKLSMPSTMVYNPDSGKQVAKYYMMPMLDAYTNVFVSPGTRTGFTGEGKYVIAGPNDKDTTLYKNDRNIDSVFVAPTNLVWVLGRFEVDDVKDSVVVTNLMKQFTLETFFPNQKTPKNISPIRNILQLDDSVSYPSPNQIIENLSIQNFFDIMSASLKDNPLSPSDDNLESILTSIGVTTETGFDISSYSPEVQKALNKIPESTIKWIRYQASQGGVKGWNVNLNPEMGNYGTNYQLRTIITYEGLGANQIQDAVYYTNYFDSKENKLIGGQSYTMTFAKDNLPPINAFWSVTLYNDRGFFCENPINRYALGHDKDNPFVFENDSLTIYIQHEPPAENLMNNWLPAPAANDTFNLMFRTYYPKEAILDSTWTPPLVKKQ